MSEKLCKYDCGYRAIAKDMTKHRCLETQRRTECLFRNCDWKGDINKMNVHCQSYHGDTKVIRINGNQEFSINFEDHYYWLYEPCFIYVILQSDECHSHFWLRLHEEDNKRYVMLFHIIHIGRRNTIVPKQYTYTVRIPTNPYKVVTNICQQSYKQKIVCVNEIKKEGVNVSEIKGKPFTIDIQEIREVLGQNIFNPNNQCMLSNGSCCFRGTVQQLQTHTTKCKFATTTCVINDCPFEGNYLQLTKHWKDEHQPQIFINDFKITFEQIICLIGNEHFYLREARHEDEDYFFVFHLTDQIETPFCFDFLCLKHKNSACSIKSVRAEASTSANVQNRVDFNYNPSNLVRKVYVEDGPTVRLTCVWKLTIYHTSKSYRQL